MTQFLSYAIPGLPYGCVFALMAVGLVLTYQTSGVFNLAYGAQAYASALIFYVCVHAGWPNWAAFVVAVVVAAPLLGLAMDRCLYRFIRSAPVLVKLVSALGMLIAIPSALQLIFGSQQRLAPPALWLPPSSVYFHLAGDAINGTELSTVIVTLAVVLPASLMSHFTQIGLRMRAMAESPAWCSSPASTPSASASRSGCSPASSPASPGSCSPRCSPTCRHSNFTELLVAAIAAAALGSLTSLPLAFWGGIGLGVVQELLGGYLPSGSVLSSGLRPALPFVVLIAFLLAFRACGSAGSTTTPLRHAIRPRPRWRRYRRTGSKEACSPRRFGFLGCVFVSCLTWVPGNWTFTLTQGLAYSIVFLSDRALHRDERADLLCQAAFAGVGAFTCAQLASHFGLSVLAGILPAAPWPPLVGVVMALRPPPRGSRPGAGDARLRVAG